MNAWDAWASAAEIAQGRRSGEDHARWLWSKRRCDASPTRDTAPQCIHRRHARARALCQARAIDAGARGTQRLGPLAGVPFAVKNLFDVAGLADAGRLQDQPRPPAGRSAMPPLIERLEAAGAVLVGALNMGEYAYDFTGENVARRALAQSARHART